MQFTVEESFWELFPDAAIGVIAAKELADPESIPSPQLDALSRLLAAANGMAQLHLPDSNIAENDVVKVWRDAYRLFETKRGARSTIEVLLKHVLKHDPVKSVNPLADICNIVSLKHALPVSAEDYDAIVGNLRLCVTAGGNDFQPLDSWTKDPALAGEVCYLDDEGAVRRCWNWCSGERTVYRASSKSALVIVESVDPARREELEAALAELSALLQHNLGATVETSAVVTRESPGIAIG